VSADASRQSRRVRIAVAASVSLALAACEPTFRDMYDQPKQKTATGTPLFADGLATRPPVPDSVPLALGEAAANTSGRGGRDQLARLDTADARQALPATVDAATLARGRERFTIYCAPCHGSSGTGDGPVVRRGFPAPPSYFEARLRSADDRHFFDVMTNGYGVMYSYRGRVDANDRWAIVAWIRHLQRSHDAPLAVAPRPGNAKR
jgi:mono/diheme cytochrome c family protein